MNELCHVCGQPAGWAVVGGCLDKGHITKRFLCMMHVGMLKAAVEKEHVYCYECHGSSSLPWKNLVPVADIIIEPYNAGRGLAGGR